MLEGQTLLKRLRSYEQSSCDLISRYVQPNASTAFGREHGFANILSYEDFVKAVPLQKYEEVKPWIERALSGESRVLTAEEPIGFEVTSGTSNAVKVIPVTPMFQRELAMALSTWMQGWEKKYPGVFDGAAYWSISPRLGEGRVTPSGVALGFDDDGAYFPEDVRFAMERWLVMPENRQGDLFETTARALLETPGLRSVSVWSPVFFLRLDEAIGKKETWSEIWPELRVVSCWADAQAAMWREKVMERLGDRVVLEPKGLLATEGVTSIPIGEGSKLARGVHFHEFIDCETGDVSLSIQTGRRYEVVLTTGAGLYRYRTGDLVEADKGDRVTFIGKSGDCSDLVGEKLDGEQVAKAFKKAGTSGFMRVGREELSYELWVIRNAREVLACLRENMHFAKALDTGQLAECGLKILPPDWASRSARYLAIERGTREGDVKLPVLEQGELMELWVS